MKCVILQPSYIPWRGYFHQIYRADLFIFYDDVQYDKRGWRNRNRVKTPHGTEWLTIPVFSKGVRTQSLPIDKVRIDWTREWHRKHLATLRHLYSNAPFYATYEQALTELYYHKYEFLADFTIDLTVYLARELGITSTRFLRSSELHIAGSKTDRLLEILHAVSASHYISGPSAKDYLEEEKFQDEGIALEYMAYAYPEYPQLYPPFDPSVTILDLLFMCGPKAGSYIW